MHSTIKKCFLIYLLFLFTTLSGHSTQATEPSFNGNINLTPPSEEIEQENSPVKSPSVVEENKTLKKDTQEIPLGIIPVSIEIPAIDVHAEVVQVGKLENGQMGVPESIETIGWYEPGFKPGSQGNAVMAGHVDGASKPGAFFNLKKLRTGDKIRITGTKGKELTFSVVKKESYLPESAPLEKIFGASSKTHLNLITCTGDFNNRTGNYEERLVIYTELMEN